MCLCDDGIFGELVWTNGKLEDQLSEPADRVDRETDR